MRASTTFSALKSKSQSQLRLSATWKLFLAIGLLVALFADFATAGVQQHAQKRKKPDDSSCSTSVHKKHFLDRKGVDIKKKLDGERTKCPEGVCQRVKGPYSQTVSWAFADELLKVKRSPHTQEKAFDTKNRFLKGQFHKWIPDNISYHFNSDENDGYVGYYLGGKKEGRGIRFTDDKKVVAQYYKGDALFSQRVLEKDKFSKLYKFFELPCSKKVKFMDQVSDELKFFSGK